MSPKRYAIVLILLLAAGLLGGGLPPQAAAAQQEQPPEPEASPFHLTYDGLLDVPRLPSAAPDTRIAPVPSDGTTAALTPVTLGAPGSENWASGFDSNGTNGTILALAADGEGNLYAGGWFTMAGPVPANRIAKWNTATSTWSALGSGMGETGVHALVVDKNGTLYAGGDFRTAGGTPASYIAKWDGASWSALGSGIGLEGNGVYALAVDGSGNLYAGGWFGTAGGVAVNHIAKWDGARWSALGTGMNESVRALAVGPDGSLYAGGAFSTAGGTAANGVARWDGATSSWHPLGSGIGRPGFFSCVDALAVGPDGSLYAGSYIAVSGEAAQALSRWDGTTWHPLGSGMGDYSHVMALPFGPDGSLYAGGQFGMFIGGVEAHNIAKWDGARWSALGAGLYDTVGDLAVEGEYSLFAGGWFTRAGDKPSLHFARWIGADWRAITGPGTYTLYAKDLPVTVVVPPGGQGDLARINIQRFGKSHPNATPALQTGLYWQIEGLNASGRAASGYSVNLTLPAPGFVPDQNNLVCRYTGSGTSWDCAMTSYTDDTITRNGITQLSDWAVSNKMPEYASWGRLAFQSARNERDWEVYRAREDGADQVNLSNNANMDIHPRLNREVTRVVFASNRRDDNFEIFAMNADGSGQTRLTNKGTDDVYPAWSPDGGRIAFQSYRDGQAEIYVMNANGNSQTRLTRHSDYDGQPAWSPDGAKIAFVRRVDTKKRIWVMNADGSDPRQLSNQPSSENPVWSPDGSQIAYDADGDGDSWQEIWLMDAAGGNQRQVYRPAEGNTDAWVRSWSPDGRFIAFTRISFIQQGGNWYWTTAYLDAWDSANPDNVTRLSNTGTDWNPDWQSPDGQAPTSSVQPLPAQSPGKFTVQWTGSDIGPAGLARIDVQVKDGAAGAWTDWKWSTYGRSVSYSGIGGHTYYFRTQARDNAGNLEPWPADYDTFTTVESMPPVTVVQPLPAFTRGQDVLLQWRGSDPGGSGIQGYDVQVRQGTSPWTNWRTGTTDTSALFSGATGTEYGFRVRGMDNAYNLEGWPGGANLTTVLYRWAIAGDATDNRGVPVAGMTVTTTPAAFQTAPSDGTGAYRAYVAEQAANYIVIWSKAAYGALPGTAFPSDRDRAVDVVLPPADNIVQNWGFESGSNSWQFGGGLTAKITSSDKHSGASAAFLGSEASSLQSLPTLAGPAEPGWDASSEPTQSAGEAVMSQAVQVPAAVLAPTLSFLHRFGTGSLPNSRLEVVVDDGISPSVVFSTTTSTNAWTHQWADLTPWAGRSVTLRVRVVEVAGGSHAWAYLDEVTVGSAPPDIWVSQSGRRAAPPGQQIVHTITYGNRGGASAANGQVTLQLPPELVFVSADPPPSANAPELRWDVGDLAAQNGPQSIRVTLQVAPSATIGTTPMSIATIASDTAELEQANNTAQGTIYVGYLLYLPVIGRHQARVDWQ